MKFALKSTTVHIPKGEQLSKHPSFRMLLEEIVREYGHHILRGSCGEKPVFIFKKYLLTPHGDTVSENIIPIVIEGDNARIMSPREFITFLKNCRTRNPATKIDISQKIRELEVLALEDTSLEEWKKAPIENVLVARPRLIGLFR